MFDTFVFIRVFVVELFIVVELSTRGLSTRGVVESWSCGVVHMRDICCCLESLL